MANDWPLTTLGEVADIAFGFPFASSTYTGDPGGVRLLRGDNVAQGVLRWDGVKRWPKDLASGLDSYWLSEGDVILAMDRPWIEAGLKHASVEAADLPALLVQRVARLRGTGRLLTQFLRYVIGSQPFTEYVTSIQTGTAVPHISGGQIRSYQFRLPRLSEQQAIADVLGTIDEKVVSNLKAARSLEEFARALLVARAATAPRVALSAIATLERAVEDPTVLGVQMIDHYSIPALDAGGAETVEGQTVKSAKLALPEKCVIISRLNPSIPRAWYIEHSGERPALASTEFAVLTARDGVPVEGIYAACTQPEFFRDLCALVTGTSTSHQRVRPEDVLATRVLDPRAISSLERGSITESVGLANHLRREVRLLRDTRAVLLPELITGRMVVKPRGSNPVVGGQA